MSIQNTGPNISGIIALAERAVSSATELLQPARVPDKGNNIALMRELANKILEHPQLHLVPRKEQEALSKAVAFASDNNESNPEGKRNELFNALDSIARLRTSLDENESAVKRDFLIFLNENGFEYSTTEADRHVFSKQFQYVADTKLAPIDDHGSPGLQFSFIDQIPIRKEVLLASKALVEARDTETQVKAMAAFIKLMPRSFHTFGKLLEGLSTENTNKLIEAAFASEEFKNDISDFFLQMGYFAKKINIPLHKLLSGYSVANTNQKELAKAVAEGLIGFYTRNQTHLPQIVQRVMPVLYKGNKDEVARNVDQSQRLYSRIIEQISAYSIEQNKFPLKAAFERYVKRQELE